MRASFLRSALVAVAVHSLVMPAFAQDDKGNKAGAGPKLPQWIVNCSNGNTESAFRCQMQQTLFIASTGQRVLAVTIEKQGSAYRATMLLPHGIDLSKSVVWSIDDGEKSQLSVASADQNGSYFGFDLTKAAIEAMSSGNTLRVETKPLSGEELKIELSLSGFAKAFGILERN